jgi:hypothetical protein
LPKGGLIFARNKSDGECVFLIVCVNTSRPRCLTLNVLSACLAAVQSRSRRITAHTYTHNRHPCLFNQYKTCFTSREPLYSIPRYIAFFQQLHFLQSSFRLFPIANRSRCTRPLGNCDTRRPLIYIQHFIGRFPQKIPPDAIIGALRINEMLMVRSLCPTRRWTIVVKCKMLYSEANCRWNYADK